MSDQRPGLIWLLSVVATGRRLPCGRFCWFRVFDRFARLQVDLGSLYEAFRALWSFWRLTRKRPRFSLVLFAVDFWPKLGRFTSSMFRVTDDSFLAFSSGLVSRRNLLRSSYLAKRLH